MSRIGRMPVIIPAGVTVDIEENNKVTVKGPKGTLVSNLCPTMTLEKDGAVIHVKRPDDEKENRALHGLTRALLENMVIGVTQGYSKTLEIVGVGSELRRRAKRSILPSVTPTP